MSPVVMEDTDGYLVKRGIRGLRKRYYKAIQTGLEMFRLHHQSECQKHIWRLLLR